MATEQFHYEHNGSTISLPHMKNIPVGLFRKLRKADGMEQTFALLEALVDDSTLGTIDSMTLEEFEAFADAWQKASGVSVGESRASSTS